MPNLVKFSDSRSLLRRILEEPQLVSVIQNLEAEVLSKLIAHVGLEDSGQIVALATADQLKRVFDVDLWRNSAPGREETFDKKRFGVWLEVMSEMGPSAVAEKLSEMDPEFIKLALGEMILVIDTDELVLRLASQNYDEFDGNPVEKALQGSLGHEFQQYWVLAKEAEYWDTLLKVLVAMENEHYDEFTSLMGSIHGVSSDYIDDNGGLFDVLTAEEALKSDMAYEREQRREKEGYVSPQSAAHFFTLTRKATLENIFAAPAPDPITQAYFKLFKEGGEERSQRALAIDQGSPKVSSGVAQLMDLLREAQVLPKSQEMLLLEGGQGPVKEDPFALIKSTMAQLALTKPSIYLQRTQELSYLANLLVAGKSFRGRRYRPVEAAEEAIGTCQAGLLHLSTHLDPPLSAESVLIQYDLVKLFRMGIKLQEPV